MDQSTSGPTVLSVIKDIVLALSISKGNEQLIRDTVQAELAKSNNSQEQNDMLRHLLVTVESRQQVEIQEACQQRDFYKARAEEMSRKWKEATKEKRTAESQEKMQILLGKLLDVTEFKRNQAAGESQFRGENRPNVQGNNYEPAEHLPWQDQPKGQGNNYEPVEHLPWQDQPKGQGNNYEPVNHLPWQDQPKGGQWNERKVHNKPLFQKTNNNFCVVNHNNYTPQQNKGKVYNEPQFRKKKDDSCVVNHSNYTPCGQQNKGKVYNKPQFQKKKDDSCVVNHNNYTPRGQQNKGKVHNEPQFQKKKDDSCVVNHNDYTPRGRGAGRGRGGGRGRSLSHGRLPHNNTSGTQTYAKQSQGVQNKSKPTNEQGGANKDNNFRGRGRGRGYSQQRGGKNHQSANEAPCELNARMNNLSLNVSYNPSSGNNQRPRNNNRGGNQSRGRYHNRSQQNQSQGQEGCVIC